jgi:prepilin signal peptidase PulO-like enzyme (type II secretory pathway)
LSPVATPFYPFAVLLGGLAGLAIGEASRALAAGRHRSGPPDRLSILLAAVGALTVAAHPATKTGFVPAVTEIVLVGFLLAVLACDVRERSVYPIIVYPGVVYAIVAAPLLELWFVDAIFGAVVCVALFGAFYGLARLRYGRGGFGGGDVSAAALLGAVVGWSGLPLALPLVSIIGAVVAIVVGVRARSRLATFPYAPAVCLGALIATLLRPV